MHVFSTACHGTGFPENHAYEPSYNKMMRCGTFGILPRKLQYSGIYWNGYAEADKVGVLSKCKCFAPACCQGKT